MSKIFASFTALLRETHDGRVTDNDLDQGYFAFGCTREHALEPENSQTNELRWFWKNPEAGKVAHAKIVEKLLVAEKQNRVFWSNVKTTDVRLRLIGSMAEMGVTVIK